VYQRRFPISAKLTVATLLPLGIAIVCCWLVGVSVLANRVVNQAQAKVRTDLNAAQALYQAELNHIRDVVRFAAVIPVTVEAFAKTDRDALQQQLSPLRHTEQFDIFTAIDAKGTVLTRAANARSFGDDRSRDALISRALKGDVVSSTIVLSPEAMRLEGPELAQKAAIKLVPTPFAQPRADTSEQAGMFLMTAAPVKDEQGNILGALLGGVLLNNNSTLVDRIKAILYEGAPEESQSLGTATVFLGDVRIATNVLMEGGVRAIGTRMAADVFNTVLLKRERHVGRAFVVKEWHFAAYEPLLSLEGVPIGALYVGLREEPYSSLKINIGVLFSIVLLIGGAMGTLSSQTLSQRLARPIKDLEALVRRVAAGERGLTSPVTTRDEVGDLAEGFNQMSAALAHQDLEIRELTRGLEQKVKERTAELAEKNRQLEKAREDLVHAEKLAAVGELAAGVAHEINNPMAIIRGNAELLQMAIPPGHDSRDEIDAIAQQVLRVERIVANLLRFARSEHLQLDDLVMSSLLDEILATIGYQVSMEAIRIERDFPQDAPLIRGDRELLRQVFTNLILNAVQAMPAGGTLMLGIASNPEEPASCRITVSDTGGGILPEHRSQLFNPFFTTKPTGTGLGLSVSYGIIKDHGGSIQVTSTPGTGATFIVQLPCAGHSGNESSPA
jgi:two-component system NtrC family sensor kinase